MKPYLLACLLNLSLCVAARANELRGVVVKVSDGDTIIIKTDDGERVIVRLVGVDAPEKRQAFGVQARQILSSALLKKRVTVIWLRRDKYRRPLGRVCKGNYLVDKPSGLLV